LLESVEQAPSPDILDRQRIKHAIRFSVDCLSAGCSVSL